MFYQCRYHMSMVFALSNWRSQLRAWPFMHSSSKPPTRQYYQSEVYEYECYSLFSILDEWRMHMHVILRCKVMIEDSINIFNVISLSVHIFWSLFWIWSIKVTSTSSSHSHHLNRVDHCSRSHSFRKHIQMRVHTHFKYNY